jgi:hypothetical protein
MDSIQKVMSSALGKISDENYEQTLAFYRFWFEIGQIHHQIPSDLVFNTVLDSRAEISTAPSDDRLTHPDARLILRFASNAESDRTLAPHSVGLQSRLHTRILKEFFGGNMELVRTTETASLEGPAEYFHANTNLIAHLINFGYVEEETIRNRILQSLIDHPLKLRDHQADALITLFKLAGPTFEAYVDPSVIDRCFKFLNAHRHPFWKWQLLHVRALRMAKGGHQAKTIFQEVVALRKHGWSSLPPPPVFTTGGPTPTGANQRDPAATPVITSLGLPSRAPAPQIPQSPPLEQVVTPEPGTTPGSPVPQSPSISIATLSDFTIADTFDDEPPLDPTAIHPHDTFYLEDGNVEVLCDNILFRVYTGVFPFHSPVLGQMFTRTNLATAESPNGCPRILSLDTATDFATLLKIVYLPEYATQPPCQWVVLLTICILRFPERNKVPDFATFSSMLRMTAKYEMPAVQSKLLDIVRNAYPETFEGLDSSKALGESVFGGPAPHPNAVLNLFIRQELRSALPMAYYMAARRGLDSLMDSRLLRNATLPPGILQVTIKGLLTLREVELKETHRLIFGSKDSRSCSQAGCPSPEATGPRISEAHQKVVDRITDSVRSGTNILQVLSLREVCGSDCFGFCEFCVEGWEVGHADARKNAWAMLPDVFGLRG